MGRILSSPLSKRLLWYRDRNVIQTPATFVEEIIQKRNNDKKTKKYNIKNII